MNTKKHLMAAVAQSFSEASDIMFEHSMQPDKLHLGGAYVVLSSFAAELYLKCVLEIETGQYPQSHNLKNLFEQLPERMRGKLRKQYHIEVKQYPPDPNPEHDQIFSNLEALLEHCQDAFVQIRYLFETLPTMEVFGIRIFTNCLRNYVVDLLEATSNGPTSQSL